MKFFVIYDSVFGNTERIAQAIGSALEAQGEVEVQRVGQVNAAQLAGAQWVFVGSPTRGFNPTPATKDFLKSIPSRAMSGVKVAAFDTRVAVEEVNSALLTNLVKVFGYAAKPIADRLQKKGGQLAAAPEGFFVEGSEGPLKAGELERAADWAKQVVAAGL